jgi:hypothetical protein
VGLGPRGERRVEELRIEDLVGHDLAALHEAVLVGAVVGDRVVQGADVIPRDLCNGTCSLDLGPPEISNAK